MRVLRKVGAVGAVIGVLTMVSLAPGMAAVQTLIPAGVHTLVDNVPGYGDQTLLWTSIPDCNPAGPAVIGMPGDELSPALINRASLAIDTPRAIFSYNPTRPVAVCNPYMLLSNVFAFGPDLYFIDNQGPNGHAALWRLPRDANLGEAPNFIADVGNINGAHLLVFSSYVFAIVGDDQGDYIYEYNKDSGELITSHVEFPADRGTLGNLKFDGRFLYWTNRGALRRNDVTNGELVTVLNGPISSLYVYGYDEQCSPDGCEQLSRIVYGQDNGLYEAETINAQIFPLYASPVANARITGIERDPTHYYFIERRPVGGGFSVDYRIFRLGVSDSVPDLIYGPVSPNGPGLDSFRTDLTWLYFHDASNESLLRVPTDEAAIPVRDLRGTGLEVTQGMQDTAQDLRLISDKRTIVRFYVRSGKPEDVYGVTASLAGSNDFGYLGQLQPVNNAGKLLTVRQSPTRINLDQSFQFELPRHWTTGGRLSLTATVNPGERIIEDTLQNNSASRSVDFTASPRLLVIYYNWSYDLGGARRTPVFDDVAASRRRMRRLYPLGEPGDAFESPGLHTVVLDFVDNELTDQVDRTDADCVKRYKKASDRNLCASDYVHARMQTLRKGSGIAADAVSYGNIAQAPAPMGLNYFTRGYANGQFASGPSTDANYASHEVGHTLGRQHPLRGNLICGNSGDDAGYPYGRSYIGDTGLDPETRFAGLNFDDKLPGSMTYIDAGSYFDTMSYCTPNWISDYTFEGMYQYLISDARPRAAHPRVVMRGDFLILSGTLTPENEEGGFVLVQHVDSVPELPAFPGGEFTLQLLDADGGVLDSHSFAAEPVEDQPGKFVFDLTVEFAPGTAMLRVVEDATQHVLAEREVSANPPSLSDVELPGAPDPVDGVVTVTWNASDDDGDPLRFDIYTIREGEVVSRPVHFGIKGNSVALDTSLLAGGGNTLIVVASDGVNTAFANSAPFTVAPRKPKVMITSPVDGYRVDWAQLVSLQADVDDVQDAFIPNSQIVWSGSKNGTFATGRWVQTDQLPVGENIITVTATNSLGTSASASITVLVGDVLVPAGPTLSVAPQTIAWHVASDDSTTQVATLKVENHGSDTLHFDVSSDADWLLIDSTTALTGVEAPRTFTVTAAPMMLPPGVTSHATLTFTNSADASDVVVVPVELSRGNVFDHTGEEPQTTCAGDCDGSGAVGIDELVRAVSIALGVRPLSLCDAIDVNGDGMAAINELVRAVNAALLGC